MRGESLWIGPLVVAQRIEGTIQGCGTGRLVAGAEYELRLQVEGAPLLHRLPAAHILVEPGGIVLAGEVHEPGGILKLPEQFALGQR